MAGYLKQQAAQAERNRQAAALAARVAAIPPPPPPKPAPKVTRRTAPAGSRGAVDLSGQRITSVSVPRGVSAQEALDRLNGRVKAPDIEAPPGLWDKVLQLADSPPPARRNPAPTQRRVYRANTPEGQKALAAWNARPVAQRKDKR
jgi:hypothetical protein